MPLTAAERALVAALIAAIVRELRSVEQSQDQPQTPEAA